jgi:hypothetical protein
VYSVTDAWTTSIGDFLNTLPSNEFDIADAEFKNVEVAWRLCQGLNVIRAVDCQEGDDLWSIPFLDEESPLALCVINVNSQRPTDAVFEKEGRKRIPLDNLSDGLSEGLYASANCHALICNLIDHHNAAVQALKHYVEERGVHLRELMNNSTISISELETQGILEKMKTVDLITYQQAFEGNWHPSSLGATINIKENCPRYCCQSLDPSTPEAVSDLIALETWVATNFFPRLPSIRKNENDIPTFEFAGTNVTSHWTQLEPVVPQEGTIDDGSASQLSSLFSERKEFARAILSLLPSMVQLLKATGRC